MSYVHLKSVHVFPILYDRYYVYESFIEGFFLSHEPG